MKMLRAFVRAVWTICKKDVRVWLRQPANVAITVLPALALLFVDALSAGAVGRSPVALVTLDQGARGQQMAQVIHQADLFRVSDATPAQAQALYQNLDVVAILTIPANFTHAVDAHAPAHIEVQINNLNTDFTNDIRCALPLSITSFYAKASPSMVTLTPQEIDAYPQDLGYIPYLAVPILVIGLMVGGMVQAGTAAAVEWEKETMKELLLSPASRLAILLGKMLAAFLIGLAGAAVVLAIVIAVMGIWPVHWGELIGFTLLVLALFTAWGTLLGTWLKRRTPLATLAIGLCVPLFFLSGPFGPISFFAPIEQLVARVFPVYYAIVVLQHAFHDFTLNTSGIGINVLILATYALGGLVLATIVVRRSTLAH